MAPVISCRTGQSFHQFPHSPLKNECIFDTFQYNSSLNSVCLCFNNFSACVMVTKVQSNTSLGLFTSRSLYPQLFGSSVDFFNAYRQDSISGPWNSVGTTIMFSCIYFSLLFTLYCCLLFCYLFVVFPFFDISCLFLNLSLKQLYVSWRVTVILRVQGGERQSFYAG